MSAAELFESPPQSGALVSDCGLYRYKLWRSWDESLPACAFVMLNPSTADAHQDDPTIRRCIGFAKAWGFGHLVVANLFAYRATNPKELKGVADPRGPGNNAQLFEVGRCCARVVVAWGAGCRLPRRAPRDAIALASLRLARTSEPIQCLGKTKTGFPRHPLYVRADTEPVPYGDAP